MTINQEEHPEYSDYSAWTRSDDKSALRNFYTYFFDQGKDQFFVNIRLTPKASDRPEIDPEQLIDTREAEKMIEAVSHPRDKAFLALLWDSGMRRAEIKELKWKDMVFLEDGLLKVHVRNGKNGPRNIFLYESVPWLNDWFSEYPSAEPEDSLWISKKSTRLKKEVGNRALLGIVDKAREEARIPERRKTNLHAWRKARATDMAAKGMNIPAMEQFFGWAGGSRMPRIYVQLADVDVENQIRDLYGLAQREKKHVMLGDNLDNYAKPRERMLKEVNKVNGTETV